MSVNFSCALAALLVCGAVASANFLDEQALIDLAEQEGYALTLHAVNRARRQADTECRCPPPPPPFDDGFMPPPPPPSGEGSGSSEEGGRPRPQPGPPRGCWPPPHHGHHHHHHHHFQGQGQEAPACELRPLFTVPDKFNFSARVLCFDRWERPQAAEMGMEPADRMDMSKYKPTQRKSLMWNKGCDTQCHFLELMLLSGEDDALAVDADAVAGMLKEDGDAPEVTAAVDEAVKQCLMAAAEMVHGKQVCRTGADEVLFCVQNTLQKSCPGSKWKGHRSCDEVDTAASKLRDCHMRRMMQHPPPPPFDGPGGPGGPGRFGPGGPGFRGRHGPMMMHGRRPDMDGMMRPHMGGMPGMARPDGPATSANTLSSEELSKSEA